MRRTLPGLLLALTLLSLPAAADPAAGSGAASTPAFDALFDSGRTMRVDVFHTGGLGAERVALDRVVNDGPWPGSRTRLIDDLNLGAYRFEVWEPETGRPIYTRGYSSLYAEWETTAEPKATTRTFHESLRFPWPKAAVQVVLKKRGPDGLFREIWSTAVDPASRSVNPARLASAYKVWTILENGPPAQKVDLLVIGEGYTEKELPKLHADARRLVDVLFSKEPFKSRKADFNVWGLDVPASESGIHRPRTGRNRRNPLGTQYDIFDSERYVLTYDNRALRDAASAAPYEFVEILVNDAKYGGGGIYLSQATASVDTAFASYVFVHEFGHHFAALADEYYTSDVAYETGAAEKPEPWEPNVTALHDPKKLKWRDLVDAATPLPTPWEKAAYEAEAMKTQAERRKLIESGAPSEKFDELFRKQQAYESKFLSSMTWSGKTGAFEGAAYEAKGLYRSSADCIMFTRDEVAFCPVCRRAIERVIDQYSRP